VLKDDLVVGCAIEEKVSEALAKAKWRDALSPIAVKLMLIRKNSKPGEPFDEEAESEVAHPSFLSSARMEPDPSCPT
jgi:hypothetical protein